MSLWASDGGRGRRLLHTPGKLDSMAFSADGEILATAGGEGRTVTLWGVPDGDERGRLPEHSAPVWSVAFSPVAPILAAGSGVVPAMADPGAEDRVGEVRVWDLSGDQPRPIARLIGHEHGAAAVGDDVRDRVLDRVPGHLPVHPRLQPLDVGLRCP